MSILIWAYRKRYINILLDNTVEPQLSETTGRHTIRSDKRGVRIGEMESRSGTGVVWAIIGDF